MLLASVDQEREAFERITARATFNDSPNGPKSQGMVTLWAQRDAFDLLLISNAEKRSTALEKIARIKSIGYHDSLRSGAPEVAAMISAFNAEKANRVTSSELMALDKVAMVSLMEKSFGSDESLGISYSENAGSCFPNGDSAVCCTNYAQHIKQTLNCNVEVVGFANENNPTARVVRDHLHPGGHDFALIEGCIIVDPWIRLVASAHDQIVFDLRDENDRILAVDLYGPRERWIRIDATEDSADEPEFEMKM